MAADERYDSHDKHTMEQKGLTVAVNIPVVQAVQNALAVAKQAEQVGESKHSRINAMAAANTAWSAYRAGQGLMQAGESLSQMANGDETTYRHSHMGELYRAIAYLYSSNGAFDKFGEAFHVISHKANLTVQDATMTHYFKKL